MKHLFHCIGLLLLTCTLWAQHDSLVSRGIIVHKAATEVKGTIRALVVGISKYQQIKSLEFADRDATEFASFLFNNPSYKLTAGNLVLLVNENAKAGNILATLEQVIDSSKAGDELIFYFSGHGDVETVADNSQGFLLAYDSPQNNYSTGAISVNILQNAFGALIDKGVKLLLITDACRSGQLAGGAQGVAQAARAFSKQWKNQVKILSAQPDELSFESKKWGGGRGVFSFFLVKGLAGYADVNRDSTITLNEIEQYAGLQISEETGFKQQPIFEGPSKFSFRMATTDPVVMKRYENWKNGNEVAVFVINKNESATGKGNIAADTSSDCRFITQINALLTKVQDDSSCWRKLIGKYDSLSSCGTNNNGQLQYTISAALMNDLQQTVNQTLIGQKLVGMDEMDLALEKISWLNRINRNKQLFYADHFNNIRRYLQVMKLTQLNGNNEEVRNYITDNHLERSIDSAMAVEPSAAYLSFARGHLYAYARNNFEDSAIYYYKKALQYSPTWLTPRLMIGHIYESLDRADSALRWFESILKMDSSFRKFECAVCFYQELSDMYLDARKYAAAEKYYKMGLAMDTGNKRLQFGLFETFMATGKKKQGLELLKRVDAGDSLLSEKLETLEVIIDRKCLSAAEIQKRIKRLEQQANQLKPDDPDLTDAPSQLDYLQGLYKVNFETGNPIPDFQRAIERTVNGEYQVKFNLALIKAKIERFDFDDDETIASRVDYVLDRYKKYITEDDLFNFQFCKVLYAIITEDGIDEAVETLKGWFNKQKINCSKLSFIRDLVNYVKKENPKYKYPGALKQLLDKCK